MLKKETARHHYNDQAVKMTSNLVLPLKGEKTTDEKTGFPNLFLTETNFGKIIYGIGYALPTNRGIV